MKEKYTVSLFGHRIIEDYNAVESKLYEILRIIIQKESGEVEFLVGRNGDFDQIRRIIQEIQAENSCLSLKDLAVNGHDLMALGITGPAIGKGLNRLLRLVLDEQLPNEKNALLQAAQEVDP